jgi:hypothetical protein
VSEHSFGEVVHIIKLNSLGSQWATWFSTGRFQAKTSDFEPLTHCRLHQWNHGLGTPLEEHASRRTLPILGLEVYQDPPEPPSGLQPMDHSSICLWRKLGSRIIIFTFPLSSESLEHGIWQLAVGLFRFFHWPHRAGSCAGCGHKHTVRLSVIAPPSMGFFPTGSSSSLSCIFQLLAQAILHPRGTWDRHAQNSAQHTSIQDSACRPPF